MSAESSGLRARFAHGRVVFRHWRWQRPFWAGLLTLIAGVPIAYLPYANLTLGQLTVRMSTTAGSGSLIIGILLFVLGLTMWFQSAVRIFAGVASILLALVSLPVANFGGLVIGFLLALIGGAMAVSWAPGVPATDDPGGKAELPDGGADPADDWTDDPSAGYPGESSVPAQRSDPYTVPEPVLTGVRPEEETADQNGGNRAG
ncbi:DUF6114 domain-containing protein [Streptomyces sp. NBC_01190]|uniref:DUF6114 domain-containing protein n=1 Tax=Streptomyces sp. NBC_01190 TaxID=2903767 RepID=UPI00386CE218|nr:DUF6114 domain-containing protein [Streptomyces sp. NBC_01190]